MGSNPTPSATSSTKSILYFRYLSWASPTSPRQGTQAPGGFSSGPIGGIMGHTSPARRKRSPSANCASKAFAALPRRNNFTFSGPNGGALGVRAWGDIAMTDIESGEERRCQVERYRVLARETTDPLATGLLRDIVLELEAELNELAEELWSPKGRPT